MQFVSFNNELGLCNLVFQRLFNNIQIERVADDGTSQWLKVPCVYGQRSRIVKGLENPDRKGNYRLPMIAFNRTGYSRVTDRLNNLHNEVKYEITSSNRNLQYLTPVPIDISFDLTVYAKYQADIDKIASNFMVFFNNDLYVSYEHPKFEGLQLNNQVVMQDGVSEEHPDEFDGSQDDVVTATFQFTLKTFLFGGTKKARKLHKSVQTETSVVVSSVVYEFESDDDVLEYLSSENHAKLSSTVEQEVSVEVSSYVDDPDNDSYDDGIPKIDKLDFGFYAVPEKLDFDSFMASVDNELLTKHEDVAVTGYISSESYISNFGQYEDDEGNLCTVLSSLSGVNDVYDEIKIGLSSGYKKPFEQVNKNCTLAPYVDRIYWKIDTNSLKEFPENVRTYLDFEVN